MKDNIIRIIIILILAVFVRLLGIATRPIWYDEAFSILFSEKGLGHMIYGTLAPTGSGSADIHPLGYYTLLWIWMKLFGKSLIATRMLSILAGLITIYLLYLISSTLFDKRTAQIAMLISTFMPFHIHYSQEIRMYAFLALWLLFATYAYLRGAKSGNWSWWVIFGITAALAQYTHNLAAFFLAPLAITPLFKKDWKNFRSIFIAGCFALLVYSPWLIQVPSQIAKIDQAYWVTKPGSGALFTLLLVFTSNIPLPNLWIIPGLVIAILIIVIGLTQTIRVSEQSYKANGVWSLYLALSPPLLLFLFSQWKPIYIERALLPSGLFFCIWMAWVIQNTGLPVIGRRLLTTTLMISFAMGIYQHITYSGFPYGPFREITLSLQERAHPNDLILHSNKLSMLPSMYFDGDLAQSYIGDHPNTPTDTLAPATQQVLQIDEKPDIGVATNGAHRIWYIIYQRSIDEYKQVGKSTHPDIDYLNNNFSLASKETWGDLQIILFNERP